MDPNFKIPPKVLEILSPRISNLTPSLNFSDYSQKKPAFQSEARIISEYKHQLHLFQTINSIFQQKRNKKLESLALLRSELNKINKEIEETDSGKSKNDENRDEVLKKQCDKLYQSKIANSQTFAKIQANQIKLEKIEKNNSELLLKTQEVINQRLLHEENLSNLEENNTKLKSQLQSLSGKLEIYQIIKEAYEEALENYKNKRIEVYNEQKRLNNYLQELKGNIRVFCKIRPILPEDKSEACSLEISDRSITVYKADKPSKFIFDRVFGPTASIDEVFEEISQLVQSALDGYKVCIFAYGQTGSGKTYTMEGPSNSLDPSEKGIIQKSVELMFSASSKLQEIGWTYKFYASAIEIYNEKVRDLLDRSKVLTGFSSSLITPVMVEISNYEDVIPLLLTTKTQRAEAETQCNIHSSRSHCLFQLKIVGTKGPETNNGVLNLIDLAGSEKLKISKVEGERLEETKAINKSLTSLGDVIHALVKKDKHIPYRNSKLTYILKNCLGGDGKTLMFVNISPLSVNFKETLNSLVFAHKVNACSVPNYN